MRVSSLAGFGAFALAALPAAHAAPIPPAVEAMIRAASDSGNADTLKTTADLAKKTNPDSGTEIDTLVSDLKKTAEEKRVAKLESNGIFEGWKGQGQAGALRTTGNTDSKNATAGLRFERDGLQWRHLLQGNVDYTQQNDVTSQNRVFASYEGNYKLDDRWYIVGLASYERDPFAGFDRRLSESLGVGYTAIKTPTQTLRLETGPAYRQTRYITGESENKVGLRVAANYTWTIRDGVDLTENATYYASGGDSTITSTTALTARIYGALSLRASFLYNREQNPPLGLKNTDTTTRLTLVYNF